MKKYFLIGLIIAIAPNFCFGAGARYTQLVREKQRKMEELEKCMGSTQGLKIAGLSTLGLTAVGVAGNVAEAKKLDEYESGIKSKEKELEKVNKDIAEKQAEINKAKEEAEAAAATQKKAEEEARNLYETNCSTTGGTINENGICVCSDQKPSRDKGSCIRVEVIAVQPNIAGSELTGVISPNNNSYTWNPVATNDGQNSVVSGSGSTPPVDKDKNSSTKETVSPTASNGGNTVKSENKPVNNANNQTVQPVSQSDSKTVTTNKNTENNDTISIQQQDLMSFQPQNPITPVDNTYVAPKTVPVVEEPSKDKSSNTQVKNSGSQSTTSKATSTAPTSATTTSKTDPCASLRASGKFKSVTTMSDGRCNVDCGYGKYFDSVYKTCESQYDVPGNTQRSSKGIINAPAVSSNNSGNTIKPNTPQPQRTNKQIMDEGVAKSNKQDNLFYGNIACWLKLNGKDGVEKTTVMDDGTCKIQCEQGYVFNSPKKRCERGIIGFRTGYMN